jgi:hypothetical protein
LERVPHLREERESFSADDQRIHAGHRLPRPHPAKQAAPLLAESRATSIRPRLVCGAFGPRDDPRLRRGAVEAWG